jgi:hypothetical protein
LLQHSCLAIRLNELAFLRPQAITQVDAARHLGISTADFAAERTNICFSRSLLLGFKSLGPERRRRQDCV